YSAGKSALSILFRYQVPFRPFFHSIALGPPSAGGRNAVHPASSEAVIKVNRPNLHLSCHFPRLIPFIDMLFVLSFLIVLLYRKDRELVEIPASLWKKM